MSKNTRKRRRGSRGSKSVDIPQDQSAPQTREVSLHDAIGLLTEALQQQRYARAEEIASAVVEKWPAHPQAMNFLGVAVFSQGRQEEGLEILQKACEYWPNDPQMHVNLGWALTKMDRLEEAVTAYRTAVRVGPKLAEPAWNLANALTRLEQDEEAAAILEKLVETHPAHTVSYITLAQCRFRAGQSEQGERLLLTATGCGQDRGEAFYHLGLYYLASERPEEALDAMKQAVKANPHHAKAEATLGHLLLTAQKQYADATEPLVRAVNLNPEQLQAWLDLGRAMGMIGRFDQAIDVYEKVLDRDADNEEATHQIEMMKRRKKTFERR